MKVRITISPNCGTISGNLMPPEGPPGAGAVDARRLDQVVGHARSARNRGTPSGCRSTARRAISEMVGSAVDCVAEQRVADDAPERVDDQPPDEADDHHRQRRRDEQQRAVDALDRRSAPEVSSAASSRPIGTSTSDVDGEVLDVVGQRVPEAALDDRVGEEVDGSCRGRRTGARPPSVSKRLMTTGAESGQAAKRGRRRAPGA